jgi:hypothetical protein
MTPRYTPHGDVIEVGDQLVRMVDHAGEAAVDGPR